MQRRRVLLTWMMLAFFVGGHWGMLQVVAWTGMLITYSRDVSFSKAFSMTFDGEHPCKLCREVRDGLVSDNGDDADPERKAPLRAQLKFTKTIKADGVTNNVTCVLPTAVVVAVVGVIEPTRYTGVSADLPRRPPRIMG